MTRKSANRRVTDGAGSEMIEANLQHPNLSTEGMTTTVQVIINSPSEQSVTHREVILCVDVSGSMSGDRLEAAKKAAARSATLLNENDRIGVVTFSSEAEVEVPVKTATPDTIEEVQSTVQDLETKGGTQIAAGLKEAQDQFSDDENAAKWLLFLSDGRDNSLTTEEFGELATSISYDGITIQPAGIGDADRELIETLAEHGSGQWAEMEDTDDIVDFFAGQVDRSENVIETDITLLFQLPNGGHVGEVRESDPQLKTLHAEQVDEDVYALPMSDIEAGSVQSAMLDFEAPAHPDEDDVPIINLKLETNARDEHLRVTANYTNDPELLREENEVVAEQQLIEKTIMQVADENPDSMDDVEEMIDQATAMTEANPEEVRTKLEGGAETIIEEGRAGIEEATKMETTMMESDDDE